MKLSIIKQKKQDFVALSKGTMVNLELDVATLLSIVACWEDVDNDNNAELLKRLIHDWDLNLKLDKNELGDITFHSSEYYHDLRELIQKLVNEDMRG